MILEVKSLDGTTFTVGGDIQLGATELKVDSITFNSNSDNGQLSYKVECSVDKNEKYQYIIINPTYIAKKL